MPIAETPDVVVVVTGVEPALPGAEGLHDALDSGFAPTIGDYLDGDCISRLSVGLRQCHPRCRVFTAVV